MLTLLLLCFYQFFFLVDVLEEKCRGTLMMLLDPLSFTESEETITRQIVDRPDQKHRFLTRVYVQPQWVYMTL